MPASMRTFAQDLREARLAKGWSQRELGERAGLPQAHISRIESGSIDPQSSTVQELARLLDLEMLLVPRPALTAVEAVLRDVRGEVAARPVRAVVSLLARLATRLTRSRPGDPIGARVATLARELGDFEPVIAQSPDAMAELQRIAGALDVAEQEENLDRLSRAVSRLWDLRNSFAHRLPDAQRPAYSLDDDGA